MSAASTGAPAPTRSAQLPRRSIRWNEMDQNRKASTKNQRSRSSSFLFQTCDNLTPAGFIYCVMGRDNNISRVWILESRHKLWNCQQHLDARKACNVVLILIKLKRVSRVDVYFPSSSRFPDVSQFLPASQIFLKFFPLPNNLRLVTRFRCSQLMSSLEPVQEDQERNFVWS